MLFVILFVLWTVFSGSLSFQTCLTGVIVCALITLFCIKFVNYRPKSPVKALKLVGIGAVYILIMLREIVSANIAVLKFIYGNKEPDERLVRFRTSLDSEGLQVLVANTITLTPGTITVDVNDGCYVVHGLDASMTDGIESAGFFKYAEKMKGL